MKLIRESLYEKFVEGGDPIYDMGIGLAKIEKQLEQDYKYYREAWPDYKDRKRINDIIKKADGNDEKENKLAQTMCKLIQDRFKAYRRYKAAKSLKGINWEVTKIFLRRAAELAGIL